MEAMKSSYLPIIEAFYLLSMVFTWEEEPQLSKCPTRLACRQACGTLHGHSSLPGFLSNHSPHQVLDVLLYSKPKPQYLKRL